MLTALQAWENSKKQELVDRYLEFIETNIMERSDNGRTEVGIDYEAGVSSFIRDKIKETLEGNGYSVKIFPGPNEGTTMKISWEKEENGGEDNT